MIEFAFVNCICICVDFCLVFVGEGESLAIVVVLLAGHSIARIPSIIPIGTTTIERISRIFYQG